MELLLGGLILASHCVLSSYAPHDALVVIQLPHVFACEGKTEKISCCWTGGFARMRVIWKKNSEEIQQSQLINFTEAKGCSEFVLTNVTQEDSGTFVCKLITEIPMFKESNGNGTIVTVTTKNCNNNNITDSSRSPPLPWIIVLGVLGPSLLFALVCFCCLRRYQAKPASVIYEVPNTDSDVDKHSTGSSQGSSQWCQVPVYESYDYFECAELKGSGSNHPTDPTSLG